MSADQIKSLNKFKIVDKPEEAALPNRAKYKELLMALKNLANDKSIYLSRQEMKLMKFTLNIGGLRSSLKAGSKRLGFSANAIEKDGGFYFFNR